MAAQAILVPPAAITAPGVAVLQINAAVRVELNTRRRLAADPGPDMHQTAAPLPIEAIGRETGRTVGRIAKGIGLPAPLEAAKIAVPRHVHQPIGFVRG